MDGVTTTDWRALPPGRELDAIVAERVFGFTTRKSVKREQDRNLFTGKKIPGRFTEHDVWEECKAGSREWTYLWRYSIDVSASWKVVDEMGRRGYTLSLEWKGADREYAHTAEVSFRKSIFTMGHAVADTAPHAIVRAALTALDSETRGEG